MDRTHSHPNDMLLYRDEYGSPEMRAVFSEENTIKKWLFMDAAIAEVESELGIIPSAAAKEITKKATGDYVKVSRVAELARGKGLDIAAELSALAEVCGKGAGEFIRMGSAGIDNYETAWGLLIKDALAVTLRDLDKLIGILADLTQSIAIPYALGVPSGNTKDRLLLATRPRCGQWHYIIANVF